MSKERKVIDSIGIMHDRDSLTFVDLLTFVERNKNLKGELERSSELSDHEYVVWEFVVYE